MKNRHMDKEGMDCLCAAIIRRAALDYWNDCEPGVRRRRKAELTPRSAERFNRSDSDRVSRKKEEEQFFLGDWFRVLCHNSSISGKMMLEQISLLRSQNRRIIFFGLDNE